MQCLPPRISTYLLCSFPGGSEGKASAYNMGDTSSIPGSGRSSGEGNGNPLQYPCLENPMDGGAFHGVTKSWTGLSDFTFTFLCGSVVKNLPPNAADAGDAGSILGWKIPWRRKWQLTPLFLPGKFHGQRSLAGYSPQDCRVRHKWATEQEHELQV